MPIPTTAAKRGVAGLAALAASAGVATVLLSCGCAVHTQHPREAAAIEGDARSPAFAVADAPAHFPLRAADRLGAELHEQSAE